MKTHVRETGRLAWSDNPALKSYANGHAAALSSSQRSPFPASSFPSFLRSSKNSGPEDTAVGTPAGGTGGTSGGTLNHSSRSTGKGERVTSILQEAYRVHCHRYPSLAPLGTSALPIQTSPQACPCPGSQPGGKLVPVLREP